LNEASISRGDNGCFTRLLQECYGRNRASEVQLVEFPAVEVDPEKAVPQRF